MAGYGAAVAQPKPDDPRCSWSAPSVSRFVQDAVAVALDDVAGWGALLAEALRETGGALSDEERAWADGILDSTGDTGSAA